MTVSRDAGEISDVLVSYATGIDRRDWSVIEAAFTTDVRAEYPGVGHWAGIDAFVGFHAPTLRRSCRSIATIRRGS
ncbi:nuclear transport factor 2 family protein [Amycolatopsis sp. GM8]|uniref:nuclear transport factor 2 family protein n=1 Tax=Amycolatopsis sp. GM8 TaxID=2896530 RepID=UPI0035AB8F61